jgi:bleomycin hydrolase
MSSQGNAAGSLSREDLKGFRDDFSSKPSYKIAQNAVTRGNLMEISLNRNVLNNFTFCFSNEIETTDVTDQKGSGTCWMFAELNWLRLFPMKKMKMKTFEFSENYCMFYDKLEKSNHFLEGIIALRDRPLDDRDVHHLLATPAGDGGEWHMLVNLISKYGLIPKALMPDTFNRENSRYLNERLFYKLREGAWKIRTLHAQGKPLSELRKSKIVTMNEVYRILSIFLGDPPEKFSWSYKDAKKKYHSEHDITPQQFYKKYVGLNLNDMYIVMDCPTKSTPYNKAYTIRHYNNQADGVPLITVNRPLAELKKYVIKAIKKGEAVLFSCDVLQGNHAKEGLLHEGMFDFELLFDTTFRLSKADQLEYRSATCNHCMVITGVDIVKDKPVKWKIENSWGEAYGKKGFFMMSDKWFDERVFSFVIHKKYLPKEVLSIFKQKPVELPPWHPMG